MINGANTIDLYFGNNRDHTDLLSAQRESYDKPIEINQNKSANDDGRRSFNNFIDCSRSFIITTTTTTPTNSVNTKRSLQGNIINPQKLRNIEVDINRLNKVSNNEDIKNKNNNNNSNVININTINERMLETNAEYYKPKATLKNIQREKNNNKITIHKEASITTVSNYAKDNLVLNSPSERTADQENAFRCIEDVHNYAKLNHYGYANESSNSSIRDDDDNEDDDDEDEDYEDENENDEEDEEDVVDEIELTQDGNADNFVKYFEQRQRSISESNLKNRKTNAIVTKVSRNMSEDSEILIDVETIPKEFDYDLNSATEATPDHHARRPMNAFLIFCKRHRAIVKDRYRTLENRAITKILGDWWATLDGNDKKCFTNLAKQNKDAFFSANPNFKWYKLPAPPLRTLSTRPSNTERISDQKSIISTRHTHTVKSANYFKFADEKQMGELNNLMLKNDNDCPLQQALSETTQYLNEYMPHKIDATCANLKTAKLIKRRFESENSASSNSSDEGANQKKLARSCKGKIYQELVNSGQIATIAKKIKVTSLHNQQVVELSTAALANSCIFPNSVTKTMTANQQTSTNDNRRCFSESESMTYDLANFDLEERIKELPALSLDMYLQNKRSTKKKKKFSTKKRHLNSINCEAQNHADETPKRQMTSHEQQQQQQINNQQQQERQHQQNQSQKQQHQQVVGSQKRKARKESITRRDVSAIENEVTALLSSATDFKSTLSNCYYINERPAEVAKNKGPSTSTTMTFPSLTDSNSNNQTHLTQLINVETNDIVSASTSDLFILAEVAAKRTELN